MRQTGSNWNQTEPGSSSNCREEGKTGALSIPVPMIRRQFNPLCIYQWGSLLHKEMFADHSDIDIALEGMGSIEDVMELERVPGLTRRLHPDAERFREKERAGYS